jgi:RNA polymerase sigma factor (sigma-70 family)
MMSNNEKFLHLVDVCVKTIERKALYFSKHSNVAYDDFYQSGFVGMILALQRLQEEPVAKQIAYVRQYILHEMIKEIRMIQHPIYIPTHLNKKVNKGDVKFSRVNSDGYPQIFERKDSPVKTVQPEVENTISDIQDKVLNFSHKQILQKSLDYLLKQKLILQESVICFNLFHGLFNYPKFSIEDIGKFFSISTNTASKRVLKVMKLLKEVTPKLFSKDQF